MRYRTLIDWTPAPIRLDNGNHCDKASTSSSRSIVWVIRPCSATGCSSIGRRAGSVDPQQFLFVYQRNLRRSARQVRRPAESVSGSRSGQTAGARLGLADVARPLGRRRSESGAAYRVVRTAALCRSGADRQRTGRRRPGSGLRAKISTWYGSRAATATRPRG